MPGVLVPSEHLKWTWLAGGGDQGRVPGGSSPLGSAGMGGSHHGTANPGTNFHRLGDVQAQGAVSWPGMQDQGRQGSMDKAGQALQDSDRKGTAGRRGTKEAGV